MTEIKAVKEPTPDPKAGKPKPKSGVNVPYYDLDQSVEVAQKIHSEGGGACSREQLAPLLKYSGTNNGGFLTRVSAAKAFGLIEENGELLRVTPRGMSILSPVMPTDVDRAKAEAFLNVDFFNKFYERFKGATLPQEVGIKNLLTNTYAVVPGRLAASYRVLMDSAEQAGFFRAAGNRSRMVLPLAANSGNGTSSQPAVNPPAEASPEPPSRLGGDKGGSSSGGDGGDGIPEALRGLLNKLPPVGTHLSGKRRKALVDAFKAAIDFLYDVEEDGSS